ncbi:hypothetical protein [Saccharopolyspora sp. 5N708]|uniref:hypothetical protein n=1 Tax=Saccharopolyspora sp. 5N708 TaxID=3457424 RepID=UPI003FD6A14E
MARQMIPRPVKSTIIRIYDTVSRPLPPAVAEAIGQAVPWLDGPWLEPCNGQHARQQLMRDLVAATEPAAVFESGTYRGATTRFLWHIFGKRVYTAEKNTSFARAAAVQFRHLDEVNVINLDSREALRALSRTGELPHSRPVLFYLDAHWNADLPLREEVDFITATWPMAIIVVDDFKVPDDPGYGFDTYGQVELSLDYLGEQALRGAQVFWPACPAERETGYRRGCVVIATPAIASQVKDLAGLRAREG